MEAATLGKNLVLKCQNGAMTHISRKALFEITHFQKHIHDLLTDM